MDKLKESVDFKTSEIEISKKNECYESRDEYQDDEIDLKNNYFKIFHEEEKLKKVMWSLNFFFALLNNNYACIEYLLLFQVLVISDENKETDIRLGPKTQYKPQKVTKDKSIIAVSRQGEFRQFWQFFL